MPRRLLLLTLSLIGVVAALLGLPAGTAMAHNTLLSSDPAAGTTPAVAPTQIVWMFDKSVPLDTMTVTLIDASGVRTELAGSMHGPSGNTEVITPLPALQPGALSLRWRLVGPDGHPLTDSIDIAIVAPPSATAVPVDAALAPPTVVPPAVESTAGDVGDGA